MDTEPRTEESEEVPPPRRRLAHVAPLTIAWTIAAAAIVIMFGWFWIVVSGHGLVPKAEPTKSRAPATSGTELPGSGSGSTQRDAPPPVPESSDTVTQDVALTGWSVLSVDDKLQVGGTLENVSVSPLTGTVLAYVYTDGELVATTETRVAKLAPGATKRVTLAGDDDWVPGTKLLVLRFRPS